LEWATASPPPVFNFAVLPNVKGEEAYWAIKERALEGKADQAPDYRPVEMPKNTATGFVCAFFATVMGFALIWHIWWMAGLGALGAFATFVAFAWRDITEVEIPADAVARLDRANLDARRSLSAAGVES
jgi:cytochrome o ubiquinol oxidase subunit 1